MEITNGSAIHAIADQSGIGAARRSALELARVAGFSENDAGRLAIAVTESATNVLKHGHGGHIVLRLIRAGIEMLAIDQGPGIANLQEALEDGRSTSGTAGIGLGAILRMASVFDIYTGPGIGTVVMGQFESQEGRADRGADENRLEVGAVQAPYPGEISCGDSWATHGERVFVVDGLGHGFQAAQAAAVAVRIFEEYPCGAAREVIEAVHLALTPTRGAAVAVAEIKVANRAVCFCGLGNISGSVMAGGKSRGMMSHNGTAGHEIQRIVQFEYPWPEDALLVMHTDGISAKWDLDQYPGLATRHPSLIAAVLFRDFRRQRDDATVVVARIRAARGRGETA